MRPGIATSFNPGVSGPSDGDDTVADGHCHHLAILPAEASLKPAEAGARHAQKFKRKDADVGSLDGDVGNGEVWRGVGDD